jgi:hypothetical protein
MRSLVLVLVATSAFAQTTGTTLVTFGIRETPQSTTDQLIIGASSCGTSRLVYWVWNQLGTQPCNNMRIWATEGSCGNEPAAADKEYDSVNPLLITSTRGGTITVNINELPGFKEGSATPCGGAETLTKEHKICAAVPASLQCFGLQTPQTLTASPLRIIYDAQPPSAPIVSNVVMQDKALKLEFSVSSDTTQIVPFVRMQGEADFVRRETVSLGSGRTVVVDGLLNATTYDVKLRAVDLAGNESADSDIVSGTPRRTVGFWGAYRDAGGTEAGGCSTAPALFPLFVLGWFFRRRNR